MPEKPGAKNEARGIRHVVEVSSNIGRGCEHCTSAVILGIEKFTEGINHYIHKHGYQLLHVGQQTTHDSDGKPWHTTVAILGTPGSPPPKRKMPNVVFKIPD